MAKPFTRSRSNNVETVGLVKIAHDETNDSYFYMKLNYKIGLTAALTFIFFNTAAVNSTFGQDVINTILTRMDEHNKKLTSLRASITMAKENVQLGVVDTTEGTVQYLPQRNKNPLIRVDWKRPEESLAVVDKQYVMYQPNLKQAYTGNVDKAKGKGTAGGALAFMNMTRAQLRANYSVVYLGEATVKGGIKTWHLQLTPKVKTSYKTAEIWIDSDGMPIQSKVVEINNDTTTVHLSNLNKNVTLRADSFQVNLPKGTKIIKG
ncbi:MAG: outer membrane lipoprotein carrier protein LolA [Blastocatellia bacterium]|nr:outer membrane lipoprotein carrier protein LolA [Blastocatellia bacterium]